MARYRMSDERRRRLARFSMIQNQLLRRAEWSLANLHRRIVTLQAEATDLRAMLDRPFGDYPLMAEMIAKRLKAIDRLIFMTDELISTEKGVVLREKQRARHVATLATEEETAILRENEQREIAEIVDNRLYASFYR